jgi:hypothetical protein
LLPYFVQIQLILDQMVQLLRKENQMVKEELVVEVLVVAQVVKVERVVQEPLVVEG